MKKKRVSEMSDIELKRLYKKAQFVMGVVGLMILLTITLILGFVSGQWWGLGAIWAGILVAFLACKLLIFTFFKKIHREAFFISVPLTFKNIRAIVIVTLVVKVRIDVEESDEWREEWKRLKSNITMTLRSCFLERSHEKEISLESWIREMKKAFRYSKFFPCLENVSLEILPNESECNFQFHRTKKSVVWM